MIRPVAAALVLTLASGGCADPPRPPASQRLVDVFTADMVAGSPPVDADRPLPTVFRFDGAETAEDVVAWEAVRGLADLSLRDGRLSGTTSSPVSLLRLMRPGEPDGQDLLEEVQVRLRASAGAEIQLHLFGAEMGAFDRSATSNPAIPLPMRTDLEPGDELRTYRFTPGMTLHDAGVRNILLRPADAPGATFEIESVRLLFRRERLAETPSGIGWQGLSEAYRETVVARAPERLRWQLTLPERPTLELALGTLDPRPVTFRISADGRELSTRTITRPFRWDALRLDLDSLAGRRVDLALALDAESAGVLGLWGSPAVRVRAPRTADAAAPEGGRRAPPRGVILILADTLRPDRLGVYGHSRPTTPHLARAAAEGARFLDAVAQGSWTKVSAPSLFTSRYVTSTGVRDFTDRLPGTATTLAEVYRAAGYATVGYSSVPFTGKANNLHQGYEELHERTFLLEASKTARDVVDRFLPWLERHADMPFFAFLHFFDPHTPYEPASPYNALWSTADELDEHRRQRLQVQAVLKHPLRKVNVLPTRDEILAAGIDPEVYVGRELGWYDGSIQAMDQEIGRVFERLRELGVDRRTLVVFISDHGEEFLDHGRTFHAQSVYGELIQVPWIVRYPGTVPAGLVIDQTVQLIDLMPTLLELSGLPLPDGLQGQSTVPLLGLDGTDRRWQPRPAISEKSVATSPFVPPPLETAATSLIFDGWKLIHNTERPAGKPERELFDHRRDPLDQTDLAEHHPEVVERLAAMLAAWRRTAESQRLPSEATAIEELSQKELDRLRALGYVQ